MGWGWQAGACTALQMAGAAPCVHVLDLKGCSICQLPRYMPGAGVSTLEDTAVIAAGLVVVSDLVHGAVRGLQHTAQVPQGCWVTVGTFLAPWGLAVDALGRLLVMDYVAGVVHGFTLGPALSPWPRRPCWVWRVPAGLAWDLIGALP